MLAIGFLVHCFAAFVTFIPQMLAWKAIYGVWLTNPYGDYGARALQFSNWNFAYLPWLFFWSPLLLMGVWGMLLPKSTSRLRWLVVGIALALLAQLHVNLSMPEIGGYGVRRMTDFFPYFGFGIANGLRELENRWGQKASVVLIAIGVAWNWLMLAHFYLHQMLQGSFHIG